MALSFSTGLDGSGFQRGLLQIKALANKYGPEIGQTLQEKIGAFVSIGGLLASANAIRQYAGNIKDLSEQYNIAVEDVQSLGHEAEKMGMSFEAVGNVLDKIGEARKKALGGDEATRAAFSRFGVSEDVYGLERFSNLNILNRISSGMGGIMSDSDRTILADLTGEKGKKLSTLIAQIRSTQPTSIVSAEDVSRIADMNARIDDTKKTILDISTIGMSRAIKAVQDVASATGTNKAALIARLSRGLTDPVGLIRSLFQDEPANTEPALPIPQDLNKRIEVDKKEEKAAKDEAKKRRQPALVFPTDGDSLAKSGLFVRGGSNTLYDLQKQANKSLGEIASSSQRLLREIENRL